MKKTKILNIITRLDRGGSAEVAMSISGHFNNNEYECTLMSGPTYDPDGSINEYLKQNSINVVYLNNLVRRISLVKDMLAMIKIYFFIRKNRFDIVHTHTSKAGIIGRWAAFFAGVKTIIHNPHGHVFYGYHGKFVSLFFVFLERFTALITDKIVTLTPKGVDDHVEYGIAGREKFTAIHPGVDIDEFLHITEDKKRIRINLGILENSFVVGTVSRLEKVKDNKTLIKAFGIVALKKSDVNLVVAGDGPERAMLQKLAGELGIGSRVHFLGLRRDIPEVMSVFDVFVLSSANEGMGKVFVQASALAKPIVATRVGGVENVVLDSKTGMLVPSGDCNAMADSIIKLIENPGLARVLGEEGRKFVTAKEEGLMRFSAELMLKKIGLLYGQYKSGFADA